MASDGLTNRAKKGKCRICHRTRCTEKHVKAVGEVKHGYATGHIWECIDTEECDKVANERLNDGKYRQYRESIRIALKQGRFKYYMIFT